MTVFQSLLVGDESLTIACGKALLDRGHGIAAVVTASDDVTLWAEGAGLPVVAAGKGLAGRLAGTEFDWLLSVANLQVIPQPVLDMAKSGAVNFHDGPLPRHAGLNAPVWALIEGETAHGVTWHRIEGGVDEGRIIAQASFAIEPGDTALTLNTKAYGAGMTSFDAAMDALETPGFEPCAQDLSQRTYHALADRPEAAGLLDVSRPAAELDRLVRALDHGSYWNPLCLPKLWVKGEIWIVGAAQVVETEGLAGMLPEVGQDALTVTCGSGALRLTGLRQMNGAPVNPAAHLKQGEPLAPCPQDTKAHLTEVTRKTAAKDGHWRARLGAFWPATVSVFDKGAGEIASLPLPALTPAQAASFALHLAQSDATDVAFAHADLPALAASDAVNPWVPLRLEAGATLADMDNTLSNLMQDATANHSFARDLPLRDPRLVTFATPDIALSQAGAVPGVALTIALGDTPHLHIDTARVPQALIPFLIARIEALSTCAPDTEWSALPRLSEMEHDLLTRGWNDTLAPSDGPQTMAALFEAQVAATPDKTALVFEDQRLTYAELNTRANQVAHTLRNMGVGADTVVGLFTKRSLDLVVGALGILKAGGAYLPLDPSYPANRLTHYVSDSKTPVIVTQSGLIGSLPKHDAKLLVLDTDSGLARAPSTNPDTVATAQSLAYLIYTSGSTGTPKGVMVENGNVANFFAGMDHVIPREVDATWLAVTSLSFDISVLELFYTTARGFTVVLTSDEDRGLISNGPLGVSGGKMEFSLYYWGNDDGAGRDKYRLLMEGAKFADENGFCAVWTPERHFHAFGGPYPNPSVTGAAVAGMTRNIGVRAGSVVAPLHHPARIAEEWAVIDNLTNGRTGLAMASGWQPDDFVLRPENTPPHNKPALEEAINQVRALWRGEAVEFPRQDGTMHAVVTQPRPVSSELNVWVTIAGNPETWRQAGRMGCNVLTHLLGQSIDQVRDMIRLYHEELRKAGHDPRDFTVTLMLHSCIAETRDAARERAREPMKDYLRSAAGLIKQYAWAFPAFKKPEGVKNAFELDLGGLDAEEMDQILDFAFERYFNDSGLFGTVEDALARTEDLRRIGVTEIACLIDYGIPTDEVLGALPLLAEVVAGANEETELAAEDFSIAAQIIRHNVTHLQCTPSMARMIAMNDEAQFALRTVKHLFLGGEALPGTLVRDLKQFTDATVTNMYGPTETTIWSSTAPADGSEVTANVGTPLVNQQMYVLDDAMQPSPVGVAGELWIGGDGVTRGYWNRVELTGERFVDNPFHTGRMYRTGDLVIRRADGALDYVGRADTQVKLRGYRIELGEIEAALEADARITQAVCIVREDAPGDKRLVAYVTGQAGDEAVLKTSLAKALPSHMVPWRIIQVDAFPLTPNRKIDRNALPAPEAKAETVAQVIEAPKPRLVPQTPAPSGRTVAPDALRDQVAAIWTEVLGIQTPQGRDNFFDLGGHSLLAVQAHRSLRDVFAATGLTITDIFRFPTLDGIAGRITELTAGRTAQMQEPTEQASNVRALSRSEAMSRRRAMRARRSA